MGSGHPRKDRRRRASAVRVHAVAVGVLAVGLLTGACAPVPSTAGPATQAATQAATLTVPTPGAETSATHPSAPAPPSAAASAAPPPSASPPIDPDDEAATGGSPILTTAAPTINPTAPASGRLAGEPDPVLTPGALNPVVTQATIGSTICVSGWTATIRPPSSFTTSLKIQQIAQYGYVETSTAAYEEDHLVSLQLGGAPSDPRNLWPEPYSATLPDGRDVGARVKDAFETSLKRAVCGGTMTLAAAQAKIGVHWVHAYYGIPLAAGSTTPTATARPTAAPTPKPTAAPSPGPTAVPPTGSLTVTFLSLPAPAIPGSKGTMTARTSPSAVCSAKVTWPSGTVSSAAGLKITPTAGADGIVSWTWNVGSTTKPGTAKATVTCTLGGSATATATFTVQ